MYLSGSAVAEPLDINGDIDEDGVQVQRWTCTLERPLRQEWAMPRKTGNP